jgi:hypothetical protein
MTSSNSIGLVSPEFGAFVLRGMVRLDLEQRRVTRLDLVVLQPSQDRPFSPRCRMRKGALAPCPPFKHKYHQDGELLILSSGGALAPTALPAHQSLFSRSFSGAVS